MKMKYFPSIFPRYSLSCMYKDALLLHVLSMGEFGNLFIYWFDKLLSYYRSILEFSYFRISHPSYTISIDFLYFTMKYACKCTFSHSPPALGRFERRDSKVCFASDKSYELSEIEFIYFVCGRQWKMRYLHLQTYTILYTSHGKEEKWSRWKWLIRFWMRKLFKMILKFSFLFSFSF